MPDMWNDQPVPRALPPRDPTPRTTAAFRYAFLALDVAMAIAGVFALITLIDVLRSGA